MVFELQILQWPLVHVICCSKLKPKFTFTEMMGI